MKSARSEGVAVCRDCGAPLTLADLGFAYCADCQWQHLFHAAVEAAGTHGQGIRFVFYRPAGAEDEVLDSTSQPWRAFAGDPPAVCAFCGGPVAQGWVHDPPGHPAVHICAEHVDLIPGPPIRPAIWPG